MGAKKVGGKCILVVEDEEEYRRILRRVLTEAGYRVFLAETGKRGLELFSAESPDLVLLDVVLPDMLGFELCRRLRAGAGRDTPVLLCTVRSAVSSLADGLRAGATDYVLKPFDAEDVLRRVRAALGGDDVLRGRGPRGENRRGGGRGTP